MTLLRLSLVALLLGVAACGEEAAQSPAGGSAESEAAPGAPALNDKEGAAALMEILHSKYIKCGDIYVTQVRADDGGGWQQVSGVNATVVAEDLTNADRLNGLTFKGSASLGGDLAHRGYDDERWADWEHYAFYGDYPPGIERRAGGWSLTGTWRPFFNDRFVRPASCEEVPADQTM